MNQAKRDVDSRHKAQPAQRTDWAKTLKPRGCEVTQVGPKGFWFLRKGKAAAEFMAWPAVVVADGRQYGRVNNFLRNIKTCSDLDGNGIL